MYRKHLSVLYEELYIIKLTRSKKVYDRYYIEREHFEKALAELKEKGVIIKFAGRYVLEEVIQ